ncbi:S-adenosyl-L-methionine-dependent methyltransferase [Patellaria atrata CBS 101060]|uniref:S-adenosyl-L-methionine-dependent methyltransferase n=1 Tax=Patellaria atrata CBS 101060 TaxID=1346257 RepID=A0A9P4SBW3_9PEZI|nr:S-adenosyl-L-methionine-dependent methyltransferase [Patellaria atrata CBS 101060]
MPPRKLNEVILILQVYGSNSSSTIGDGMTDIRLKRLVKKRTLTITSLDFSAERFEYPSRWDDKEPNVKQHIMDNYKLVCRYVCMSMYKNAIEKKANSAEQHANTSQRRVPIKQNVPQKYTFADMFCCSGRASRGAEMADIRVLFAMDNSHEKAKLFTMNAEAFIYYPFSGSCDILHLSPPCKYFSHANWLKGMKYRKRAADLYARNPEREKNDDDNRRALYTIKPIVEKLRPRVVILEQTDGLIIRHANYFNILIGDFISLGYTVAF